MTVVRNRYKLALLLSLLLANPIHSFPRIRSKTATTVSNISRKQQQRDSTLSWKSDSLDRFRRHHFGKKQKPEDPPKRSLSSKVSDYWYQIPGPIRFFASGNMGNCVLFFTERTIFRLAAAYWMYSQPGEMMQKISFGKFSLHEPQLAEIPKWWSSVTFFAAYVVHVPAQHYFHALLVYGLSSINTPSKYWQTLAGTYSTLVTAAMGSTLLNGLLLQTTSLSKPVAFVVTMWVFALMNYLVLGWIVRRTEARAMQQRS